VVTVVALITITVLLVIPWSGMLMSSSCCGQQAACRANQKQILLAIRCYQNQHDGRFPVWPVDADGRTTTGIPDGLATTAASFELLCRATGGELSYRIFRCQAQPGVPPPPESGSNWHCSTWAAACRAGTWTPMYVYDWSAPHHETSGRVILADRFAHSREYAEPCWRMISRHLGFPALDVAGSHWANVTYGDGLTVFVPVNLVPGSNRKIMGFRGQSGDDDPWTSTADGGNPWRAEGGSATRCFLR
jgi:hypothetical protein